MVLTKMDSSLAKSAGPAGSAHTTCIQITTVAEPGEKAVDTLSGEPIVAPAGYFLPVAVNSSLWPRDAALKRDRIHSAKREMQLMATSDTGRVGMVVDMTVDDNTTE